MIGFEVSDSACRKYWVPYDANWSKLLVRRHTAELKLPRSTLHLFQAVWRRTASRLLPSACAPHLPRTTAAPPYHAVDTALQSFAVLVDPELVGVAGIDFPVSNNQHKHLLFQLLFQFVV